MITSEQLKQATELLTNAVNYNLAMQAAFVSTDDMITVELNVDGKIQAVSIPTYHNLLNTVNKLSQQVQQMQISNDGNDVVQLLTQANSLQLLYLKRKQFYVQPPIGAKLSKFDYETVPTNYSSSNKTAMYIDLTDCDLPMDAIFASVHFDNDNPMLLPILYSTTCFDTIANVLQVTDDGYIVDSNNINVDDEIQCKSSLYKVISVAGNVIKLEPLEIAHSTIEPGDVMYSITGTKMAHIEVPIVSMHNVLHLQIQYAGFQSAVYSIDVADAISTGIQIGAQTSVEAMLSGKDMRDTTNVLNISTVKLPDDLKTIVEASKPNVDNITTTIKQTNTHQYINSSVETIQRANATLELAKKDKDRYEQLLIGDLTDNRRMQYQEALVSAQQRYDAAQIELAKVAISAQDVSPQYEAKISSLSLDANNMPIIQYVVRYQYLSYDTKTLSNDWLYAYGDKRTIDSQGRIAADADNYAVQNFVRVPIHAYEQLAFQLAAVLSYGQPLVTVMTDWSDTIYTQISDNVIAEQSVTDMLQNMYEARLYTNVQQALKAAGVTRHITRLDSYAHAATDIIFADNVSVAEKINALQSMIEQLTTGTNEQQYKIELVYNGNAYNVTNNGQVDIDAISSYYNDVFNDKVTDADKSDACGSITEDKITLRITNIGASNIMLQSVMPGATTNVITGNNSYAQIGIVAANSNAEDFDEQEQHYGQLLYASNDNNGLNAAYDCNEQDIPMASGISSDTTMSTGIILNANGEASGLAKFETMHDGLAIHTYLPKGDGTGPNPETLQEHLAKCLGLYGVGQTSTLIAKHNTVQRTGPGSQIPNNLTTKNRVHFVDNDKYLSGLDSIGAFMYIDNEFSKILGTELGSMSTGITIEPSASYDINITFQARFMDRTGVIQAGQQIQVINNMCMPVASGDDIRLAKLMPIVLKIGNEVVKFKLSFTKRYQ